MICETFHSKCCFECSCLKRKQFNFLGSEKFIEITCPSTDIIWNGPVSWEVKIHPNFNKDFIQRAFKKFRVAFKMFSVIVCIQINCISDLYVCWVLHVQNVCKKHPNWSVFYFLLQKEWKPSNAFCKRHENLIRSIKNQKGIGSHAARLSLQKIFMFTKLQVDSAQIWLIQMISSKNIFSFESCCQKNKIQKCVPSIFNLFSFLCVMWVCHHFLSFSTFHQCVFSILLPSFLHLPFKMLIENFITFFFYYIIVTMLNSELNSVICINDSPIFIK